MELTLMITGLILVLLGFLNRHGSTGSPFKIIGTLLLIIGLYLDNWQPLIKLLEKLP